MRLLSARVQNYRSIRDSGKVSFDPEITCVVGRTGSGKTSFLKMLEGASRGVRFEERELPRSSDILQDYRDGRKRADEIAQLAITFEVEEGDRLYLPEEYKSVKSVSVTRTFDCQISVYADGVLVERASAKDEEGALADIVEKLAKLVGRALEEIHLTHPNSAGLYKDSIEEAVRELREASMLDKREFDIAVESLRGAARALPLNKDLNGEFDKVFYAMSQLAEKVAVGLTDDPAERLYEQVPKPLYREDVFKLDDEITINAFVSDIDASRTFRCISAICGLTPGSMQRIRNANPAERAAYLKAKSERLSRRLNSFWSQEVYRFELAVDGDMLQLRVADSTTGATTLASERSEGFKWWVAFFLEVSTLLAGENGRRILLLDNPATGLHDEGKGDVLRFMRAAAESGRLQVVYSTHERALIDPWRTDRVRIVGLGQEGTRITAVPAKTDGGQLESIMRNIGSPARYSLFGAPRMVCFEGASDTYIASAANEYMLQGGSGPALDKDTYSINSIDGIDSAPQACRLYGGLGLEFLLVVDSGAEAESMKQRLDSSRVFGERFVELRQVLGRDADMEDMVDRGLYYEAFRRAYGAILAEKLPPVDEIDGRPGRKRAKNYEEWFRKNNKGGFKKTLVAQQMFAVMMGRGNGADTERAAAIERTAGNFAKLFGIIAGRYSPSAGQ